jgi:hypothetical protein
LRSLWCGWIDCRHDPSSVDWREKMTAGMTAYRSDRVDRNGPKATRSKPVRFEEEKFLGWQRPG